MIKQNGESGLGKNAVEGMKEIAAIGISYRYAAPEAFNRMHLKGGITDEGKPVGIITMCDCFKGYL